MGTARNDGSGPSPRQRKKPKIKYPGVRARWAKNRGAWVFRGVVKIDGRQRVGPTRLTQEEASDDYRKLKAQGQSTPWHVSTIGEAIEMVVRDAENRGVPATTIERTYRCHARYILKWFQPDARVAQLKRSEILWFINSAKEAGRHPNTLIQKDLPLIGSILKAAGLPNIVPEIRTDLRHTLKREEPQMHFFEPDEVRDILHRMRNGVFRRTTIRCQVRACGHEFSATIEDRDGDQPKRCPACGSEFSVRSRKRGRQIEIQSRERDADLVELIALTGLRPGELGRIQLGQIDHTRKVVRIKSKDKGHPRNVDIVGRLEPIFDKLCADARDRAEGNWNTEPLVRDSMNRIGNLCRRWKDRLAEPRLSGRTLRHSFVTGLLYSGARTVEAKGLAGHRNLSTTDRYTHEISRKRVEVLTTWQNHLEASDDDQPADEETT